MVSSVVEIIVGSCPRCGHAWPECTCGRPTPPKGVPDHMEPEPPAEPSPVDIVFAPTAAPAEHVGIVPKPPQPAPGSFVEWVQWKGKRGDLSLYHVRVTSGGWLLCGRHVPPGIVPAADSFAPHEQRCAVCLSKLRGLAS